MLGRDYTLFISTESMRCFVCGKHGHIETTYPGAKEAQIVLELNSEQNLNAPESNGLPNGNADAVLDAVLNVESSALAEVGEGARTGCNVEITKIVFFPIYLLMKQHN